MGKFMFLAAVVGRWHIDDPPSIAPAAVVVEPPTGRRSVVGECAHGAAVDGRGHHHHGRLLIGINGWVGVGHGRWWWRGQWWRRGQWPGWRGVYGSHRGTASLWRRRWRRRRWWWWIRGIHHIGFAAGLLLIGLQGAG